MLDITLSTTLYVGPEENAPFPAAIQLMLRHKGLKITKTQHPPTSLAHIPLPALVHDKFIVYGTVPLFEFICERFPDPASLPLDPTNRAIHRMIIAQILNVWYPLFKENEYTKLIAHLNELTDAFKHTTFFLNKNPGAIDCILAPLLQELIDDINLHPRMQQYARDLQTLFPPLQPTLEGTMEI